jgi:hypothetical protein
LNKTPHPQLGRSATMTFEPDGLTCVLEFPLRRR